MHKNLLNSLVLLLTLVPPPALAKSDGMPKYRLEGSCGEGDYNLAYPTEEAYLFGLGAFCDTFVDPSRNHTITSSNPLMVTYDLPFGNGKRGPWVYEIMCQLPNNQPGEARCIWQFVEFLNGAAGGLGKAYCVKDSTGGDAFKGNQGVKAMSGQGEVVVWGGLIDEDLGKGGVARRRIFKVRKKGYLNTPT